MNSKIVVALITLLSFSCVHVDAKDCVILLHGLARTENAMNMIEKELLKNDYDVVNQGYPSRDYDIETLAVMTINKALPQCQNADNVHFVTHSMGGILLRAYLQKREIKKLHRVVMLGPPNQGSELADLYARSDLVSRIGGPAFLQLKRENGLTEKLGAVDYELGVIAGDRSVNLILSMFLPGKDDGKVSIDSTKVDGMSSHIVMHTTHPFMLYNSKVISQVLHFLKFGDFKMAV